MRFHFNFCFFSWYSYRISSSAIGLEICVITARIKKYKSIIKKKKKHDKIISKLDSIKVFKALIDSNVSHNGFALTNNILKEFYDMKEEIKSSSFK